MKKDETIELLREIRDLQKEELALLRADKLIASHDKNMGKWMAIGKGIFNIAITMFSIGAFWYFYHTIYGSGLL